MNLSLSGRTALITGGSLGLGKATAASLYAHGAKVAILARDRDRLKEAEAEITKLDRIHEGGEILSYACDVANAKQIAQTFEAVREELGPPEIVINNAGKSAAGSFVDITDEQWQEDLDLKLMAAVRLSRLAWPHMVENGRGRIINILNIFAKTPRAGTAPTSVSRAAGMALTKVLSAEGAPHGITANAILIGYLKSDQIRRQHESSGSNISLEDFIENAGRGLPMGRLGESEDCANLALFLASDAANYLTGTAISLDGGLNPTI